MMNRFVSWLSNATREFVAKCHRARRRRPSPRTRTVRPCVVSLEDRTVPAIIGWDGGGDGTSFDDALNWDLDAVPGPNDDASIPYIGGSISGTSASVRSLTSDAPSPSPAACP